MSPKLATAQLPTVLQQCFSKMAAEDHRSGQVTSLFDFQINFLHDNLYHERYRISSVYFQNFSQRKKSSRSQL